MIYTQIGEIFIIHRTQTYGFTTQEKAGILFYFCLPAQKQFIAQRHKEFFFFYWGGDISPHFNIVAILLRNTCARNKYQDIKTLPTF